MISGDRLDFPVFSPSITASVDGWLLGRDTADVPLGLRTADTVRVLCQIGDERPEEALKAATEKKPKILLRPRLGETVRGSVSVFSLFRCYHKT